MLYFCAYYSISVNWILIFDDSHNNKLSTLTINDIHSHSDMQIIAVSSFISFISIRRRHKTVCFTVF